MKVLIMLFSLIWLPFTTMPQATYQFSSNSTVSVSGTSTLHDWIMDTKNVQGSASIEIQDNGMLSIKEVAVAILVESLKSGKNAMDENAYKALKSQKYPTINFQLKGFEQIELTNGKSALEVNGNLTIAGKTRPEKILVEYQTDNHGNLLVSGSKGIKMTDYGVTPPEVMFGTIKTGNDITINFDLFLAQNNSNL